MGLHASESAHANPYSLPNVPTMGMWVLELVIEQWKELALEVARFELQV